MKQKLSNVLLILIFIWPLILFMVINSEGGLLYIKALGIATIGLLTFKYLTDL